MSFIVSMDIFDSQDKIYFNNNVHSFDCHKLPKIQLEVHDMRGVF